MKILFCQQDPFKSYNLMELSGLLKKNKHKTDCVIESLEKDFLEAILGKKADIIAFSLNSSRYKWFKEFSKTLKSRTDTPIIVGGIHPTFYPEMINECEVDIICRGEGELAFLELLDAMQNNKDITSIENLWVKKDGKLYKNNMRDLLSDLDILPMADFALYDKYSYYKGMTHEYVISGRGCPYQCSFCFNAKYNELYASKGKIVRKKSVKRFIRELKYLKEKRKIKYFVFIDDTFFLGDKEWFDDFFKEYKSISIPYSLLTRFDVVKPHLIDRLSETGCHSVRIGLESSNEGLRKVMKKGLMVKNDEIRKICRYIKKRKLKLQIYNLIGTPGETLETALDTYEYTKDIHPTNAWCSLMQPYPGTEIRDIALKNKIIDDESMESFNHSLFYNLPFNVENRTEMINLQKLFQFGNMLRLPRKIMILLIKAPENIVYEYLFKFTFALSIMQIDKFELSYVIKTAIISQKFFKR